MSRGHAVALERRLRRQVKRLINPAFRRRETAKREAFLQFRQACAPALAHAVRSAADGAKRALVVGAGFADGVKVELGLIKGLELAGFEPVVLTWRDPWLAKYYELAGVSSLWYWDDLVRPASAAAVRELVAAIRSSDDLLGAAWEGVRVGRFAASTALRQLRVGSLDLQAPAVRAQVAGRLAAGIAHANAARQLVARIRPSVAMFLDRGYTPQGELFDVCLAAGVDTITWNVAHRSHALMLKRYTESNQDEHPAGLSASTWQALQAMPWTEAHRERLSRELTRTYETGDWYSEVGTQFHTRLFDPAEVRRRLGLDPRKKTAVIFAHILWDGTFFWGEDVFESYESWLIETVRAACANPRVQWVIKVHPANRVKNARAGVQGESAEEVVLRRAIGTLPPHVTIMTAESEINNLSLFPVTDYGLTVRGTIGIELASFGIPVLTAGTGRYDRKGFTVDAASPQEYLERLRRIHEIPPLTPAQRELAERFASGVFVLRPLPLTTMQVTFAHDERATSQVRIMAGTAEAWRTAPDLRAFAAWVADGRAEDYLAGQDGPLSEAGAAAEAVAAEFR